MESKCPQCDQCALTPDGTKCADVTVSRALIRVMSVYSHLSQSASDYAIEGPKNNLYINFIIKFYTNISNDINSVMLAMMIGIDKEIITHKSNDYPQLDIYLSTYGSSDFPRKEFIKFILCEGYANSYTRDYALMQCTCDDLYKFGLYTNGPKLEPNTTFAYLVNLGIFTISPEVRKFIDDQNKVNPIGTSV